MSTFSAQRKLTLVRPQYGLHRHENQLLRLLLLRKLRRLLRVLLYYGLYGHGRDLVQWVGPGRPPRARHEWDGTRFFSGGPPRV
jgi:hypothetical protein